MPPGQRGAPPAPEGAITAAEADAYLESKLNLPGFADDPALARGRARAMEAGVPDIAVSPMQGQFLSVLVKGIGATRVLEIGTLWGYSTSFFSKALPPHGQIDTLEFAPLHAKIANETFLDADLYPFPKVHVGAAMDLLTDPKGPFAQPPGTEEGLPVEQRGYDFVFIDANKDQIHEYFQEAIRLTRKGGIIYVDNAVRNGRIARAGNDQPSIDVEGLRKMYDWVQQDAGKTVLVSGMQTVGAKSWDGFAIAYKL